MAKVRKNFTVDVDVFERFKLEVDNMSQEIERFMEARASGNWESDNDKDIQKKIQEYEDKLEDAKEQEMEAKKRQTEFKTRLQALKAQKQQQEQEKSEELEGMVTIEQ